MPSRHRSRFTKLVILFLATLCLWPGCSDDETTQPEDTTAPAAVTTLVVGATTTSSVTLRWTAPGDDGSTGQAATYDLRYMTGETSSFQWAQATKVTGVPAPQVAGSTESFVVTGLASGSTYAFGLLTGDEESNWSPLSNLVSAAPGGGTTSCQVTPTTLAFGAVAVGATHELTFTITNNGTTVLSGTVAESCTEFTITSGGGAYTLNADESRTVTVRYAPTAAGSHTCTIDTGLAACADVSCTGTGTEAPVVEMVRVPAGSFTMGSDATEGDPREEPEHTPSISAFDIDTYEVTNARYAEALNWARAQGLITVTEGDPNGTVLNATGGQEELLRMDAYSEANPCRVTWNGSTFGVQSGYEEHPVVSVTWFGAAAFCNWRSGIEGKPLCYDVTTWQCSFNAGGYRLPTEAEWEKAARGSADERTYPWGEQIDCDHCNYGPSWPGYLCVSHTVEVGDPAYTIGASPYGARHMAGNVDEWCNDWMDESYYSDSPAVDPAGPASGDSRVSRGSSWFYGAYENRCANRNGYGPGDSYDGLGFRTARPTGETADCEVAPTSLSFPETEVGSTSSLSFTITNSGSGTISGSVSESCDHFEIASGAGAYSLPAGQSKSVTVAFAPTSAGTHSCTIETGLATCADVACSGTATSGGGTEECFVSPTVINFSSIEIGGFAELAFIIRNDGTATLSGTVAVSCSGFSLSSGGGAYALAAGQQRTVVVRFEPTVAGSHTCVVDTGNDECGDVTCHGSAVIDAPECSVSASTLGFSTLEVGAHEDQTFNVQNSGGGTLTGTISENCEQFELVSGGGAYALTAGQSQAVIVRYAPTEAGTHTCEIETGVDCANVGCTGTAIPEEEPPMCQVEPASISFPDTPVGQTEERSFTVTNVGGGTLTGSVSGGCADFSLVTGDGSYALGSGESHQVTIRFAPTEAGDHTCTVGLGSAACEEVVCSGVGTQEPGLCRVEPASLSFGTILIGGTADQSFTIHNDGGGPLSGTVAESCPDFTIESGDGPYEIEPGGSLAVTVRFAPTVENLFNCEISLGGSCDDVPCSGVGGMPPEENMVLIPAGSFTMGDDDGEVGENEHPEHEVTLSAYYMDVYEVTNTQYAEALNWAWSQNLITVDYPEPNGIVFLATGALEPLLYMDGGSNEDNQCRVTWDGATFGVEGGWESHPVTDVTWWGAAAYCNWRSGLAGRTPCYDTGDWSCNFSANGYRLPTEAEWEKAARGGTDARTYPWGEDAVTCDLANFFPDPADCVGHPAPVDDATYSGGVSPFGVWQMAGNVWEWCNDWYDGDYYSGSPDVDPTGPADTGYRVTRGGSWWDGSFWQRCSVRSGDDSINHFDRLGLRAVRR